MLWVESRIPIALACHFIQVYGARGTKTAAIDKCVATSTYKIWVGTIGFAIFVDACFKNTVFDNRVSLIYVLHRISRGVCVRIILYERSSDARRTDDELLVVEESGKKFDSFLRGSVNGGGRGVTGPSRAFDEQLACRSILLFRNDYS